MKELLFVSFVAMNSVAAEPLTIKGLAPGDQRDKIALLGPCTFGTATVCVGRTNYGTMPADFTVFMTAGRVTDVTVTFGPARSAEALAGLTMKYGPPIGPSACKPDAKCQSWTTQGLKLILFEDIGAVKLIRSAPVDGY